MCRRAAQVLQALIWVCRAGHTAGRARSITADLTAVALQKCLVLYNKVSRVAFFIHVCFAPNQNRIRPKQEQKKAAELEKQNNMSTMRVSGPRPLEPDLYDRFACAVCMKIAAPVLLGPAAAAAAAAGTAGTTPAAEGNGAAGGEEAGGKEAGGGAAAAPDPDVAQCAKCGVRVHRECYGVPEGLGAPGAGEREFSLNSVASSRFRRGGLCFTRLERELLVFCRCVRLVLLLRSACSHLSLPPLSF